MKVIELSIKGMKCAGCSETILGGLNALRGVKKAALRGTVATISYDEAAIDEQRIIDAIRHMRYEATVSK